MLKKTITYTDYNDNEVSEDFYFNFTKLELMEKELELGGIDETVKRLSATQNTTEAYSLFKQLILASYGEKSEDGKRFIKSADITAGFEQSPACSELIIEFLQNPQIGAQFIEGTLPAKMVAEVKAAQARGEVQAPSTIEMPTAPPVLEVSTEPTDEELLRMKPQDMTREQLMKAFELKSKTGATKILND